MNIEKQNFIEKIMLTVFLVLLASMLLASAMFSVLAVPEGPSVTFDSNTTKTASNGTGPRSDGKGVITILKLNAAQQNMRWKAYLGNVTGTFVLQDAEGYKIYAWPATSSVTGQVFISRNSSLTWTTIDCSNSTINQNEETDLSITDSSFDSITSTFSASNHTSFLVATRNMTGCPTAYPYVNSTAQTSNSSANKFQEVLLGTRDASNVLVYAGLMEQDYSNYKNGTISDFQMIVPDYGSGTSIVPYYFFVELD
jgi:hypothetical protein